MATFYVLPARHILGQRFADYITALFPGTRPTSWEWPDLAESLATLVEAQHSAFVVYREDLDEELSVKDALMRDFGAAMQDEIIEIQFGKNLLQVMHLRWSTEKLPQAA